MKSKMNIRPISAAEKKDYKCLFVLSGQNESSIDISNKSIFLKTAVNNKNFNHYEIRDISSARTSAIVYLINDQSNKAIKGSEATHIIEHSFPTSEIKTDGNEFELKNEMIVMVFNDNSTSLHATDLVKLKNHIANLSTQSSREQVCAFSKIKKDDVVAPKEACGGVVVGS